MLLEVGRRPTAVLAAAALGGSFTKRRKTGLLLSGGVRNVLYMVDSLDLLRKEEKENTLFSVKKKKSD